MTVYVAKNFVLLKPVGETKNESGIILPEEQSKEKQQAGVVYKIGSGKQPFEVPMKEGDILVYEKYMDNTLIIPGMGEKYNPVKFEYLTLLIKKEKNE